MDDVSKREYFAGLAMQGLLANPMLEAMFHGFPNPDALAGYAVEQADALLTALSTNNDKGDK